MIYQNTAAAGKVASVEFTAESGVSQAFIRVPSTAAEEVRGWLGDPALKQQVISETTSDGETLIVTRSAEPAQHLLQALLQHGESLAVPPPAKKPFNPWAWRGVTSMVGQGLQLASSIQTKGATISERSAIALFATLNMGANLINFFFGGQEKDDPHQLRLLKNRFNAKFAPYAANDGMPDPEDTILSHRPSPKETLGQTSYRLLRAYSVSFGEIGLRTLASLSLAFPITHWRDAAQHFMKGETLAGRFKNFYTTAKCHHPATFIVGLMMLTGKFVSFASKEPDPYNPTPPSWLDIFREKVTFRLSSVIEGAAATYMAYDRFKNKKIHIGGTEHPDYYGGFGNVVFVGGYGVRLMAPYGSREVNMPELYAHVASGLAQVPSDKRAELTAQAAQEIYEHFKTLPADKKNPMTIGTIYEKLQAELETYHQIPRTIVAPTPRLQLSGERQLGTAISPQLTVPTL